MDDGLIVGKLEQGTPQKMCDVCGRKCTTIKISKVNLPKGINQDNRLIVVQAQKIVTRIGIECGDYARFHRQIAHIRGNLED